MIAVGPETENAASAGAAGLYAFELPLVFAAVAVEEVSGLCDGRVKIEAALTL